MRRLQELHWLQELLRLQELHELHWLQELHELLRLQELHELHWLQELHELQLYMHFRVQELHAHAGCWRYRYGLCTIAPWYTL